MSSESSATTEIVQQSLFLQREHFVLRTIHLNSATFEPPSRLSMQLNKLTKLNFSSAGQGFKARVWQWPRFSMSISRLDFDFDLKISAALIFRNTSWSSLFPHTDLPRATMVIPQKFQWTWKIGIRKVFHELQIWAIPFIRQRSAQCQLC